MAIKDLFNQVFRKPNLEAGDKIKSKLPFVHLFGHEKSYGKPHPHQYDRMIDAYKSWIYACAWKNGTGVAKCKLKLYKNYYFKDREQFDIIISHPLLDLLKSVNPFSNRFELFTLTQIYLELTGNAYWYMPKSVLGVPYMIWSIPPHWVKVVPSEEKFIDGYVVRVPGKGQDIPFEEQEIVHFKFPSPFDLFYGISPTFASMYGADLNTQSKEWAINFFMNNAQPSGVLTTDEGLSSDQYQRLRDNWNLKYRGNKNAGKIAILESGLKYQQIGSDIQSAKLDNMNTNIRDEILAMFGVPASKLGLVEDVNRANADANDYTYQKETILPRLTLIEEKINEKIVPMYDVGIVAKFDNPVPQDLTQKLEERKANIASGFSSIDEEREKEGLEPYNLPETQVPLIPFSLTPAGQPRPSLNDFSAPDENDEESEEDDDTGKKTKSVESRKEKKWVMFVTAIDPIERHLTEILKRFFERQHGDVMRKVNLYKGLNSVKKDIYSNIIFNMREQNNSLVELSKNAIRQSIMQGLTLGVYDTGAVINFDLFEPNILRAVDVRVSFFAETINTNTAKAIQRELNISIQNGETVAEVAKRLDKVYSWRDATAKTPARTEVVGATNEGQLMAFQEAGVKYKEWSTARDENVRDSHVMLDGKTIGVTELFKAEGGSMRCPGDRSNGASPEETINCRCTINAIYK